MSVVNITLIRMKMKLKANTRRRIRELGTQCWDRPNGYATVSNIFPPFFNEET
jgi:hypothetical protein